MNVKKQVRAALAVAVSSTLLIPGYVLAAEKPAQPGTVRPADKVVAQPGTDKQARSESKAADAKPSTAQPGTDKPSQKPAAENTAPKSQAPAQPSVADKPDTPAPQAPAQPSGEDKPVTPAPTPNYSDVSDQNTVPAVAQQPAQPVQSEQATGGQTLAEQATETTASQSVRDSANGTVEEEETQPVRTTQADERARFELASAVERDGDVRQDATKEEKAVTREDEKPNLAPVQAPDGEPDNDGDTAPQPNTDVLNQTISAGASVAGAAGNTAVEFDASPVASTLSADSAASTVSATVDHVAKQVTVEAGNAEFQVQAPVAVEQIAPPQVSQAVDQAAKQAQTAINTHLASLPNGEQVRDTAIGQVETWFQAK